MRAFQHVRRETIKPAEVIVSKRVLLALTRGVEGIAHALLRRQDVELILLYDRAADALDAAGIPCTRLSSYHTEKRLAAADARANSTNALVAGFFRSTVCAEDFPELPPNVWSSVGDAVQSLGIQTTFQSIALLDAFESCHQDAPLSLVVVPQDICRETKAIVLAANQEDIPTVHLLHGFPYGATNMHDDRFADWIAVYSDRVRQIYLGFGYPPDRIVVTGNPEWDIYMRPFTQAQRVAYAQRLRLNPNFPIFVYALTYGHSLSAVSVRNREYMFQTTNAVLKSFAELKAVHPDWQFVLRPHPNDPDAPTDLISKSLNYGLEDARIDTILPAHGSATLADVMVCSQSNLGIEALFLGKPVVNVILEEFAGPVVREGMGPLYLPEDGVVEVRASSDLTNAIGSAYLDLTLRTSLKDRRTDTIQRFNSYQDGMSTARFISLLETLLGD